MEADEKLVLAPIAGVSPLWLLCVAKQIKITMGKGSNFFGQPIYGQLIKSLDREKIVEFSRKHGGEKYVKSFDGYLIF